jgi:hypothetical protein
MAGSYLARNESSCRFGFAAIFDFVIIIARAEISIVRILAQVNERKSDENGFDDVREDAERKNDVPSSVAGHENVLFMTTMMA